jgi:hypothetical protein
MSQPGIGDLMSQWKQMSDQFLKSFGQIYDTAANSEEGQAATQEFEKNYVAARATMAKAAREAYGPIIEAAGAVPLSEFQRLQDQVHTILLRMDRIDDALAGLLAARGVARPEPAEKAKGRKRKK